MSLGHFFCQGYELKIWIVEKKLSSIFPGLLLFYYTGILCCDLNCQTDSSDKKEIMNIHYFWDSIPPLAPLQLDHLHLARTQASAAP